MRTIGAIDPELAQGKEVIRLAMAHTHAMKLSRNLPVRHMRPENADDVLKVGRSFLVGVWRRETVRWKAIAYSYPVH